MDQAAPRGTRDILPPESDIWQQLEKRFDDICHRYGYGEIRLPSFEHTEVFARGVGDSSDIVRKEMYTFDDRAGRSLTLRPEGTAGVARAFIQHGLSSEAYPVKLYYRMNLFRYEAVQKGRQREFNQFGVECFGSADPAVDAEVIGLVDRFLTELGLTAVHLELNSIGCPDCRSAYHETLREWLRPRIASFCPDCRQRFDVNPLRILDCKVPEDQARLQDAPLLFDELDPDCRAHFERVTELLDAQGIRYQVNPRIVRGLDYYTRTVFEFISENVGTQGTICGGGRYDGLVAALGGEQVPGCGFAMGVERLLMELEAQSRLPVLPVRPRLYLASLDRAAQTAAAGLADRLRQGGITAGSDLVGRSLRAQMKYAARSGYSHVIVLGSDELASGTARLRRLADGVEEEVSLDADSIRSRLDLRTAD
ncbi:MAG: histidine--tRNA ligase [Bacillota bacterium]|nr:histidine--tRNA ligase [Bacillota bacterium]